MIVRRHSPIGSVTMAIYTYVIGKGDGHRITTNSHSEMMAAADLDAAKLEARRMTVARPPSANKDTVVIHEQVGGDSPVRWASPVAAIRS